MAYLLVYLVGVAIVAAALHHELDAKPKACALVILGWPVILPGAALLALFSLGRVSSD